MPHLIQLIMKLWLYALKSGYNTTSAARKWFENYQTNRQHKEVIKGGISSTTTMNFVVPQGYVVRSILFTLPTSPLISILKHFKLIHPPTLYTWHSDIIRPNNSSIHFCHHEGLRGMSTWHENMGDHQQTETGWGQNRTDYFRKEMFCNLSRLL